MTEVDQIELGAPGQPTSPGDDPAPAPGSPGRGDDGPPTKRGWRPRAMAAPLPWLPVALILAAGVVAVVALLVLPFGDDEPDQSVAVDEPRGPAVSIDTSGAAIADPASDGEEADLDAGSSAMASEAETDRGNSAREVLVLGEDPSASTTDAIGPTTSETTTTDGASTTEAGRETSTTTDGTVVSTTGPGPTVTGVTITTASVASTTTTRLATTSATTSPSTTRLVTTRPITTTTRPRTTTPPTTTAPFPDSLIASPTGGSEASWGTSVRFVANAVPGAASYCWTFLPDGYQVCRPDSGYTLPARSNQVNPGPTTVQAQARDGAGRDLMMGTVRIDLAVPVAIVEPGAGDWIDVGSQARLVASSVPTADRYCWEFVQNGTRVASFCTSMSTIDLSPGGSVLGRLALVPVTIRHTARRGSVDLGEDSVTLSVARRL